MVGHTIFTKLLVSPALASVLFGHTDHPECVMDNSLQKRMEQ